VDRDRPISSPIVRWRKRASIPRTFRLARYVSRFVLPFTLPISRWKVRAWGWLAVWIALQVGLFVYVNLNVTGTRAVDDEVRWAAYIGLIVIAILGFVPTTSGTEDGRSRALDFRSGDQERAVIVDYQYAITREGKMIGFRLVTARKVYWTLGVAAVEMPDRRFLFVPAVLFPSRQEWREIQAWLSSP